MTAEFVVVENSHTCIIKFEVTDKSCKLFFFLRQTQHNSYTFSNPSLQIHKSFSPNHKPRNSYAHMFCYYCCSEYGAKHIHTPASKVTDKFCTSTNQYVNSHSEIKIYKFAAFVCDFKFTDRHVWLFSTTTNSTLTDAQLFCTKNTFIHFCRL